MDRITLHLMIFEKTEHGLELLTELPMNDEDCEVVPLVLPVAA